jgi:hypothetical protein
MKKKRTRQSKWLALLAFLIFFHTWLAYGLRDAVVGVPLVFLVLNLFIEAKKLLALSISLMIGTLLAAGVLRVTGLDRTIYYRPHEILGNFDLQYQHGRYKRNAQLTMEGVHGDLQSMTDVNIAFPRIVIFRTDAYGFRNTRPYHNQAYLLVGDSFVVGTGSSQEDILSEHLYHTYGLDVYNAAYVGGIIEYERYLKRFSAPGNGRPDVLLFLFEGNDFPETLSAPGNVTVTRIKVVLRYLQKYIYMFEDTGIYRYMRSVRKRLEYRDEIRHSTNVRIIQTDTGTLAFYVPYIQVTERQSSINPTELEAVLKRLSGRIAAVFFIPTKYRVYHYVLEPNEPLPNTSWEYLSRICSNEGLRCVDLTMPLIRHSAQLLPGGRFTYWPDDTHWNAEGMAVAAEQVFHTVSCIPE